VDDITGDKSKDNTAQIIIPTINISVGLHEINCIKVLSAKIRHVFSNISPVRILGQKLLIMRYSTAHCEQPTIGSHEKERTGSPKFTDQMNPARP
jgi:hypothetical protein